jgi:arsenite methyltransferase
LASSPITKPDYGIDAPAVMRNLFLIGTVCLLGGIFLPHNLHLFREVSINTRFLLWTAGFLIVEGFLFLSTSKLASSVIAT